VEPAEQPPPNLVFTADLFLMTPEGAVVGRPASTVRAGEERWVARRLAELGVPVLRTVRGTGTFEGADAMWIRPDAVLLACGLRTNEEGARQVAATLGELGVRVEKVRLGEGTMHLMGTLRMLDRDLAVAWPGRVPRRAVEVLDELGVNVVQAPDSPELISGQALNLVTLAPRRILMPAGNPVMHAFYRDLGIACREVTVDELAKAAGGVACMSGILRRRQTETQGAQEGGP